MIFGPFLEFKLSPLFQKLLVEKKQFILNNINNPNNFNSLNAQKKPSLDTPKKQPEKKTRDVKKQKKIPDGTLELIDFKGEEINDSSSDENASKERRISPSKFLMTPTSFDEPEFHVDDSDSSIETKNN